MYDSCAGSIPKLLIQITVPKTLPFLLKNTKLNSWPIYNKCWISLYHVLTNVTMYVSRLLPKIPIPQDNFRQLHVALLVKTVKN